MTETKTLGERALELSFEAMRTENPPSATTKAMWFMCCTREGRMLFPGISPEQAVRLNHCAAAACFYTIQAISQACWMRDRAQQTITALRAISVPSIPHGYRAAAKELMVDAIASKTWHSVAAMRTGSWLPLPGDLAIYDRSIAGRPETSWWGHVDRVVSIEDRGPDNPGYVNLGANEGPRGEWVQQWSPFSNPRLLGFIAYPLTPVPILTDEERKHVDSLIALTNDQAEADYWDLKHQEGVI